MNCCHETAKKDLQPGNRRVLEPVGRASVPASRLFRPARRPALLILDQKIDPMTLGFRLVEPTARREGRAYPWSQSAVGGFMEHPGYTSHSRKEMWVLSAVYALTQRWILGRKIRPIRLDVLDVLQHLVGKMKRHIRNSAQCGWF
jgi:hypothetical protein